jgi:hypothetical protein
MIEIDNPEQLPIACFLTPNLSELNRGIQMFRAVLLNRVPSHKRAAQSKVVRMMVPRQETATWTQTGAAQRQNQLGLELIVPGFGLLWDAILILSLLDSMAGTTGLEPATSAVTEVHLDVTH